MLRVTCFLPIASCPAYNTFPTPQRDKPPDSLICNVSDCSAVTASNMVINSYSGSATPNCDQAKIFSELRKKPIQVLNVVQYHPAQFVHCLVQATVYTGTCGNTEVTYARNYRLYNKELFSSVYSPDPKECYKANSSDSIKWVTPKAGSYFGEEMWVKIFWVPTNFGSKKF